MTKDEEIERLNNIVKACATAVGASCEPECSIEFKELLQNEIILVLKKLNDFVDICVKFDGELHIEVVESLKKLLKNYIPQKQKRRLLMTIKPLRNLLVIKPDAEKTATDAGILLPGNSAQKPTTGIILETGPGLYNEKGDLVPTGVSVGDRVLFHQNELIKQVFDNEEVWILPSTSVVGVLS